MKMVAMMLNGSVSDNDGDNDNGNDIEPDEPAGGTDHGNDGCDDVIMMSLMLMWCW